MNLVHAVHFLPDTSHTSLTRESVAYNLALEDLEH